MFIAMAASRKLQGEIERCLKKVTEGVDTFEDIWQKVHNAANSNQKEKYEADLKKEIKKLQRLRDQIKSWIASAEIKDKSNLLEYRKLIETQMERFKVVERETKTKAYSKEGLGAIQKMDPVQKEREEVSAWLIQSIDSLNLQLDKFESELELLVASSKKKRDKDKHERTEGLRYKLERHRFHIKKLETLLRMLDNMSVEPDQIKKIKEDVEYYIETALDIDYHDNEYLYDDIMGAARAAAAAREAAGENGELNEDGEVVTNAEGQVTTNAEGEVVVGTAEVTAQNSRSTSPTLTNHSNDDASSTAGDEKKNDKCSVQNPSATAVIIAATSLNTVATTACCNITIANNTATTTSTTTSNNTITTNTTITDTVASVLKPISVKSNIVGNPTNNSCGSNNVNSNCNSVSSSKQSSTSNNSNNNVITNNNNTNTNTAPTNTITTISATNTTTNTITTNNNNNGINPINNNPKTPSASSVTTNHVHPGISVSVSTLIGNFATVVAANSHHSSYLNKPSAAAVLTGSTHVANENGMFPMQHTKDGSSNVSSLISHFSNPHHSPMSLVPSSSIHTNLSNNPASCDQHNCIGGGRLSTTPPSSISSVPSPIPQTPPLTIPQQNDNLPIQQTTLKSMAQETLNKLTLESSLIENSEGITVADVYEKNQAMYNSPIHNNNSNNNNFSSCSTLSVGSNGSSSVNSNNSTSSSSTGTSSGECSNDALVEAHVPPLLGVAPLGPVPLEKEHQIQFNMLEAAFAHIPHPSDTERQKLYIPRIPCKVPEYYTEMPLLNCDTIDFFLRLSPETLFFIFYYMEGTKAQFLAAQALKKQSWRFHTKYMMWFQRHEEPKIINEDFEQGTYIYFDFEKWCQRRKDGFTFEYKYLEDRDC